MIQRKANKFRLYPSPAQRQQMAQTAGACRFVYNLALEQRKTFMRRGRKINFASQCQEITMLRNEVDWLKAAPVHTLQQTIKDLDRAYDNWFSGRADYPTPRKKGLNDTFRFPDPVSIKVERTGKSSGRIKLPKLGWVPLRGWYAIPGAICSATISHHAGQWHAAVQWQREINEPEPSALPTVGIDRGITVFAALSDGTVIPPSNHGKKALRALAKAQRSLARKKKGSNNRRKQRARVAKIHLRVANARKDTLHKASTIIANNHGTVVLEKLQIKNMSRFARGTKAAPGRRVRQKSGLNRSILDQGWGMFGGFLGYKLPDRGGILGDVPAKNSSRECFACGLVDERNRSGIRFLCIGCGHEKHADTNASQVIKRRWDTALKRVDGTRATGPDEARSTRMAA